MVSSVLLSMSASVIMDDCDGKESVEGLVAKQIVSEASRDSCRGVLLRLISLQVI